MTLILSITLSLLENTRRFSHFEALKSVRLTSLWPSFFYPGIITGLRQHSKLPTCLLIFPGTCKSANSQLLENRNRVLFSVLSSSLPKMFPDILFCVVERRNLLMTEETSKKIVAYHILLYVCIIAHLFFSFAPSFKDLFKRKTKILFI